MNRLFFVFLLMTSCLFTCQKINKTTSQPVVQIASAMKNVMWKGRLGGVIKMDSLVKQGHFYGVGPLEFLQGELLLLDSKPFVSRVTSDSTMEVYQDRQAQAPFFVYSQVLDWTAVQLPENIHNIATLEAFINQKVQDLDQAFDFKLKGKIRSAEIHIQNLPVGTAVSSPKEAHQGQINYSLGPEEVDLLGFFSRKHQGVFTHHDTYVHLHLITADHQQMEHLDAIDFFSSAMTLYLPKGMIK